MIERIDHIFVRTIGAEQNLEPSSPECFEIGAVLNRVTRRAREVVNILLPLLLPLMLLLWLFLIVPLAFQLRKFNKIIGNELNQGKYQGVKFDQISFAETKETHEEIRTFLTKHKDLIDSQEMGSVPFFNPLGTEIQAFSKNMIHLDKKLGKKLFIQENDHPFSDKELKELSDFFGPEEDYEEDTFNQLSING